MVNLVVSSAAEGDYAEALSWYADRSIQTAERFEAEFDRAIETIASDPERFPRCDERHRFYLMRDFPFKIIYRQHGTGWVVIAVAHTAREPRFWSGR
ncbi:MAG: type II toxin-antitoxin system RelE/ParE family toxin [Rhodopirellula sp.]|nr:type II toxin-antitoxin system RelE/ParE family toxin [Rhodopirellula sp.]